jgi:hypothetical protein
VTVKRGYQTLNRSIQWQPLFKVSRLTHVGMVIIDKIPHDGLANEETLPGSRDAYTTVVIHKPELLDTRK